LKQMKLQLENVGNHNMSSFEDSYSLYLKLNDSKEGKYANKPHIRAALTSLSDALRIFGPECVIASYNGGKDAVVIMHLLRAALAAYSVKHNRLWRPKLIYFVHDKEFPEVKELVFDTAKRYDLELVDFECNFVDGLTKTVKDANGKPLAFVLGTRKGDPNCKEQEVFAPSSDWMPPFMRVNPILSWSYGEVWDFLRDFELPYCSLYDEGYTSLGRIDDTEKNPALKSPDGSYLPASELRDYNLERAGRMQKEDNTDVTTLALAAIERNLKLFELAKSVAVVFVENQQNQNPKDESQSIVDIILSRFRSVGHSVGRVRSRTWVKDVELQEEVARLTKTHDLVLVFPSSQTSDRPFSCDVLVDTISFDGSSPRFYANVLVLQSSQHLSHLESGLKSLSQKQFKRLAKVVVNTSTVILANHIKALREEGMDAEEITLFGGFDFLDGHRTILSIDDASPLFSKLLSALTAHKIKITHN